MDRSARCAESGTAARQAGGTCRGSVGTPASTASPPAETREGAGTSRPPFPRCASCGNAGHGRDVALRLKIDRSN